MFVLLTASMFIKGPMVFALLLPGIVLFQWLAGKRSTTNAWCGFWPWIASFALFSIWVICGIKFVPGFYEDVVMKEFLGRFSETVHRPQPVLYYLPHLLQKFAPGVCLSWLLVCCPSLGRARAFVVYFAKQIPISCGWCAGASAVLL